MNEVEFSKIVMRVKKHKLLTKMYTPDNMNRRRLLYVISEDTAPIKPHHAIVTTETDGYLVSVLKQPTQNKDSYVEVMVTENHPLYSRFNDAIAVLNVAGTQTEIEGVGEAFQTGVYHVVLDVEEHNLLSGA